MINAALLNEWQGKFSLDHCAKVAGVQEKKGGGLKAHIQAQFPNEELSDREVMGHYWRLPGNDAVAAEYAQGDGTTTWQLIAWQRERLAKEELLRVHDIECRLIPILVRQTMLGIRIDEERLHLLHSNIRTQVEQLLRGFPEGFNPKSPSDVQKWCEANKATDWPLTEKLRRPSFPESWLETHPAGLAVVKIRKLKTLLSSFIQPMLDTHLFNGRVHADYNQLRNDDFGTITGRLSSSNPNLMQIPHHSDYTLGRAFRSIFVPDEGKIWGSRDFSQAEPRLLAYYSRCKVLMDDYCNNPSADAHQAVADATGLDRQTGKRVNQTLLTGGGKGVLVKKYKITEDEAERVWEEYFKRLPEIKRLQYEASSILKRRGYVRSLLGRKARLNDPQKSYVAVNRLLQGGNADIIKLKMVQIDEYLASIGRPIQVMLSIHDSLDYQFSEEHRPVYEECGRIMVDFSPGQPITLDVPMRVDSGEGPDWGVATYGELKE
jgi:DNA polymerase-1